MSSYNRKVTEYALLPNGAYPLDARSHFKDFIEAYNKVSADKICAAEDAKIYGNDKLYYIGEIITTTGYGDGYSRVFDATHSGSNPCCFSCNDNAQEILVSFI